MKRFVAMFSAFVLLCGIILPSAAFAKIAESENVESFETDFLSDEPNEEGLYVKQGTKVVNSIVLTRTANDEVGTVIKKIEDLYDLDGDYINTKITATEFTNNFDTGVAESKVYEEELNQKKSIRNKTKTLLNEENDQEVKKNVEEVFADVDMSSIESKPEKGIDYKKLEFVDKEMKKFETKRQLAKSSGKATCKGGSVDCAGAYDTYYNYDRTTGKFIVQALSANAHEYVKLKGSTLGSSKNASSLSKFQKQADEFESFIIDYMDYDFYEDTFEWFVALMGLAGLVLGYGTGPAGWVAICVFYAGAYSTFQTLTSKGYATLKRLNYSENAAKYNQNCRELLRYKNWEDVKTSLVDGY